MALNYLIYDLESRKRVLQQGEQAREGEVYATSWGDRTDMGISVLCAMNPATWKSWVFMLEDLHEFQALAQRYDVIAGFNIKAFDDLMLKAHGFDLSGIRRYDMLHEIAKANKEGYKRQPLNDLLKFNRLPEKTSNGADAPYLWQTGQVAKLITYCLDDCWQESLLFNRICSEAGIWTSDTSSCFPVHPALA